MKRVYMMWLCGWLLACVTGGAIAEDVRKTAEAGMVVTGSIEVNSNGSLHGYVLDQPEKLPPIVVDVVRQTVSNWDFTLSGPTTDVVKTKMTLRVVAKPVGDGNFRVSVAGASFGEPGKSSDGVTSKERSPTPQYPKAAIDARVSGTVYVVLRVGRDGTVQEAIAEQVNLDQYDTQSAMNQYRKTLADASLAAARRWTFNLPTTGSAVDDPYWVVRIPVNFNLHMLGSPGKSHAYGSWDPYIPGPRQTPPWIGKALANESPDAASGDGLRTGDSRLQLTTPLSGV